MEGFVPRQTGGRGASTRGTVARMARAADLRLLCRRALAAAALLLAGCERAPQGPPADTLVRLSEDEPKRLDPQAVSDLASLRLASELFEGLTRPDGRGGVEPGLAASWSVTPDGRRWRFRLRPNLAFSDGQPIDASTFARGFARVHDPATASPHAALFGSIASVAAIEIGRAHV